jgi:hypothetical protein
MKSFAKLASLVAFTGLAAPAVCRADVTLEHGGKIVVGLKKPETLVTFSMKNSFTPQRHKSTIFVDATPMAGMASMGLEEITKSPVPAKVEASFIERLDDDRMIASSPQLKKYFDEPLSTLMKRSRVNIWAGLDPELGKEDVPQLTPEQRSRLGREIRASIMPFAKKNFKVFFRPLPGTRVINGVSAHGFRLGTLFGNGNEWARITAEWWIADGMKGDDDIRAFVSQAIKIRQAAGGPTASMWANETPYVLLAMLPDEFHQAWATFVGDDKAPNYGFQGTPLQFYVTVTPPAMERMESGDIRLIMELKKSDTDTIDPKTFDAPADYTKVPLEPYVKMAENYIKSQQAQMQKMIESGGF